MGKVLVTARGTLSRTDVTSDSCCIPPDGVADGVDGLNAPVISLCILGILCGFLFGSCGRIGFEKRDDDSDVVSTTGNPNDTTATTEATTEDTVTVPDPYTDADSITDTDTDASADTGADTDIDTVDATDPDMNTYSVTDSDTDTATDIDTGTDSGSDTLSPCVDTGSVYLFDLCWHLSAPDESCIGVCSGKGGYDPMTEQIVGTPGQGGALENCAAIFTALGYSEVVTQGYNNSGGLGCHRFDGIDLWWLTSPDFDPTNRGVRVEFICGCTPP